MYQRRVVGLVLVCAAAALTAAALTTRTWWGLRDSVEAVRVGLRDAEICPDASQARRTWSDEAPAARCTVQSLRAFRSDDAEVRRPRPTRTFVLLGTLVLIAGLAGIGTSIAVAATTRGPMRARALPSVSALTWAGFAAFALAFLVAAPASLRPLRAGLGPLLAMAGAACGVAASFVLARADRAREPSGDLLREATRAATITRTPALLAGAIGAALILTALTTHAWFRGHDERSSLGIGVQEAKVCGPRYDTPDGCAITTIPGDMRGAREPTRMRVFLGSGTLAGWTGIAAVITFALAALLALLHQAVPPPLSLGRAVGTAGGVFVVSGIAYVLSRPPEAVDVAVSYGAVVGLGGGATLIGAGVMFGRWVGAVTAVAPVPPPIEEVLSPATIGTALGAPVPATIPACPRCGSPMLWVRARQAWLCTVCKGKADED